jgi:hypothetical protein
MPVSEDCDYPDSTAGFDPKSTIRPLVRIERRLTMLFINGRGTPEIPSVVSGFGSSPCNTMDGPGMESPRLRRRLQLR